MLNLLSILNLLLSVTTRILHAKISFSMTCIQGGGGGQCRYASIKFLSGQILLTEHMVNFHTRQNLISMPVLDEQSFLLYFPLTRLRWHSFKIRSCTQSIWQLEIYWRNSDANPPIVHMLWLVISQWLVLSISRMQPLNEVHLPICSIHVCTQL